MDLDDDDFEIPSRTSPHFRSRNTPKKKHDEDLVNHTGTDKRPLKRRKTMNKKSQYQDAKLKQNIGFKCSPHLLFDLLKTLDTDQRKWVDELGFGILLSMPNCRLPKDLTVWLVNHFSWKKQALTVRGRTVPIKLLMKKLLCIPDGPFPVPLPRSKRGKSKCIYPTDEDKEMKDEKGARGLSYKATYESLIATHDPVQFKRSFMLYVLCIYFAPSSGHFINLGYSPIVSNVDLIKDMNWCDHVADVLIEGIREYRDSKAVNVNVHGCVHVLLLIYIDMVKSPILEVPIGYPRVLYVTTELLDLLDLSDLKSSSCDGPEYGKLELADSPYGEEFVSSATPNGRPTRSIPGCSSTAHTNVDVQKVLFDGMQQIEAQYSTSRDKIHAEMYETYKQKIQKIDSERSSAICALHKKISSLHEAAAASPHTTKALRTTNSVAHEPLARNSIAEPSSHGTNKEVNTTPTAAAPICSTPPEESCLLNKASQSHNLESSTLQFPVELSEIPQRANNIPNDSSEHPYVHIPIPLQETSVEATHVCTRSPDASERSIDLQKNCLQLSTIRVNSIGAANILNVGSSGRNRRLFPEHQAVCPEPKEIHSLEEDDPMGFDIMKKVSEIGKQVSQQALKDTDAIMSSPFKSCHFALSVIGDSTASSELVNPAVLSLPIHEDQSHPPLFGSNLTEVGGRIEDMETPGDSNLFSEPTNTSSLDECTDEYPAATQSEHVNFGGHVLNGDSTFTPQLHELNGCSGLSDIQLVQSSHQESVIETVEGSTFVSDDVTSITSESAHLSSKDHSVPEPETIAVEDIVQCSNRISPHTNSDENISSEDTTNICVLNPPGQSDLLHNLQHGPCGLQQVLDVVEYASNCDSIITEPGSNVSAVQTASTNASVESPKLPVTQESVPDILHVNESVSIEELSVNADSLTVAAVHTVGSPISDGEFFEGAGSVNTAIRARAKRFGKTEHMVDAIAELKKTSIKVSPCATQTYADHVEKSIFWGTARKDIADPARNCAGKTKILIRGVHVSEEEFVHSLMPTGHVDTNFMWLCSEAIMLDWHSKSRTILNQAIVKELTKPHDCCDHEIIASKLKILQLDQIDQLYLPVPNRKHWILVLITISRRMIEIYDSFRTYKRGDDPYDDLWKTIGYNLQIALSQASSQPVPIHDSFEKHYAQIQAQSNLHDCGLEVIRMLVCHNGKDLIGYGKKNMVAYRKEVSHTLVYHRYNDLNPRRHSPSA